MHPKHHYMFSDDWLVFQKPLIFLQEVGMELSWVEEIEQ